MVRSALFLFILFLPSLLNGQNKIEWADSITLTAENFHAKAPNTGSMQTVYSHVVVEYQFLNYELLMSKSFNKNVSCYFYPDASWIDSGAYTNELLRYANTLLDLNEWMTRELRKRFRENRSAVVKGQHGLIYDQLVKEHTALISQYAKDTDFGRIEPAQASWERKISDALAELGEYCKTCKPPKSKKKT